MPQNVNIDPPPTRRPLMQSERMVDFSWSKWFQRIFEIVTNAVGFYLNYTYIADAATATTYQVVSSDVLIFGDATTSQINVNLTPGQDGKVYRIKNVSTTGPNSVVVTPFGGELIDGFASTTLTNRQSITIIYIGTSEGGTKDGWWII